MAAIQTFLNDRTSDSGLQRSIAAQSVLPGYGYRGLPKVTGTSMLLSGGDHTRTSTFQDLAALSQSLSTRSTESESSSLGIRQLSNLGILDVEPDGTLVLPPLQTRGNLECPFNFLSCILEFDDFDEWVTHSLTHFKDIGPSTSNKCCFCEEIFRMPGKLTCWRERMKHVAVHHRFGYKLAHARPDFELYAYLWSNRLISDAEYHDLKGNSNSRSQTEAANSYQSAVLNGTHVAYTVTNSRRHRNR